MFQNESFSSFSMIYKHIAAGGLQNKERTGVITVDSRFLMQFLVSTKVRAPCVDEDQI